MATSQALSSAKESFPASPSLKGLTDFVASDMAKVNAAILTNMQSDVPLIPQLAQHLLAAGGKRLRPMLTLVSAKLCGVENDRPVGLAACVEFIHTATLLHDDVVDESDLRRGQNSANAVWGNQASVLVGDFLFSRAFELMVADGSLKVLGILSATSARIAEGEVQQLTTVQDLSTTKEIYLEVIGAKTAALFAAATQIGAAVAERPETEEQTLKAYGYNLGMTFQLVDDVLDYMGDQAQVGKTVGDDFAQSKLTLPVILVHQYADASEKKFLERTIAQGEQASDDLPQMQALLTKHKILEKMRDDITHYADNARAALDTFPDSEAKAHMLEAIDFCVDRVF